MSNPPPGYPRVSPYLLYEDAAAAVGYLQESFGFRLRVSQTGAAGRTHNELLLGEDGLVMVGQAHESFSSSRTLGAFPPSMIHVYVDDVDADNRVVSLGSDPSEPVPGAPGQKKVVAA